MLKDTSLVLFLAALLIITGSPAFSADSSAIDKVLDSAGSNGGSISPSDAGVIENYVSESLSEMLAVEDFGTIVEIREELSSRSINRKPSKYSLAYASAMKKHLPSVFDAVNYMAADRQMQMTVNLMILLGRVDSMELAEFGISMLDHHNPAVRYWAVKSIASPSIAEQLKSDPTGDAGLAAKIVSSLDGILNEDTPAEIMNIMVAFADKLDSEQGDALLLKIADIRMESYRDWSVKYELMDAGLLNAIARSIDTGDVENNANSKKMQRYAQLYSYVIQRYILGFETLGDIQLQHLGSVLISVEQNSLGKLLARSQTEIKRLVSSSRNRHSLNALSKEHDSLLGSPKRQGRLSYEVRYDYGKEGGKVLIAPKKLKAPASPEKYTDHD